MNEPLIDGWTAASVLLGAFASLLLRGAQTQSLSDRAALWQSLSGHVLLGIAVSLLLYRWVDSVTNLPRDSRPSGWLSGLTVTACGIGIAAAVRSVTSACAARRVRMFVMTVLCSLVALASASAWNWTLLAATWLVGGLLLARWRGAWFNSPTSTPNLEDDRREPTLVFAASVALLLLLIGTWQHVVSHEANRTTRSPRYSAWPRPSAVQDAWERTGWLAPSNDAEAVERAAKAAVREQLVACGLGLCLLIVAIASHGRSPRAATPAEAGDAS